MEEQLTDLISLREAAELLGKSKVTVWRWVRSGKLRGFAVADRLFVRKSEVESMSHGQDGR